MGGREKANMKRVGGRHEGGVSWGFWNLVCVWFGSKGPALGSQEDNGKENEKKGRFMDVCVCPHRWSAKTDEGGLCVQNVCIK